MRFFIQLSYDGSQFSGWQIQPSKPTVQQVIEETLTTILQEPISVTGCGRTDAGVHAKVYYLHFDCKDQPFQNLEYKLNSMLPNSIAVQRILPVQQNHHARYDATKRSYTYHIHFDKNPFLNAYSYHCFYKELDIELMQQVAQELVNYTDFSALSKDNEEIDNAICTLFSSTLTHNKKENTLELNISANRFLHNMIRRIVGLLITVGRGKISAQEVRDVMRNGKQFRINFVAPPQGLFLSGVEYPFIDE